MMVKAKRLMASFGARFDHFVTLVENHEAVADSVIRDVRAGAAKIKVQLGRVTTEMNRLDERHADLRSQMETWRNRAERYADSDETQALECVRRLERTERELSAVERQRAEFSDLRRDLQVRLDEVERRLSDLRMKRTSLSSRAVRANATRAANDPAADIDDVFDRWEMAVVENEYRDDAGDTWPGASFSRDAFERELDDADNDAALRARLDELRGKDRGAEEDK